MTKRKTRWVLVGLLCLALLPSCAVDEGPTWETYMAAGDKALQQGNYQEAEKQLAAAVKEAEGFGPQDPRLATSLNDLAELYRAQGKYAEAEPLYQRSLAIRAKALGSQHPDVAESLENYAALLRKTGRSAEAAKMEAPAEAIRARHAFFLGGLWETYMDAATKAYNKVNYPEAEKQWVAAVKEAEGFGPQDPRLATSLNDLGELYLLQRRYAEAEPLYKRSLARYEKAFGPWHSYVAGSLNNLAALYDDQGKYAEAEPLYKRSLAIYEKAFGPWDDWHVATVLNNLAGVYRALGKYAEAEPLHKRALTIREKALGPEHPDVAESLENYAALLRKTGRSAEAAKMEARAKAIRAKHAEQNPAN